LTKSGEEAGVAFERISIDYEKMGGLPCIRDLRIPVGTVVGQLAAGRTVEQLLEDYPDLEREDVYAALEYAAAAVHRAPKSPPEE
jgi:uncharacterized protein (DUF433 family)